jgi:hypothetical protein
LSFDAVIADALELGALRCEAVKLTYEQMAYIESIQPVGVPLNVLTAIAVLQTSLMTAIGVSCP